MFHVGQLVICVDDVFPAEVAYGDETMVSRGHTYTVREAFLEYEGTHTITVAEIVNTPREYSDGLVEFHFAVTRFRPIDDSKIEVFRKALKDVPADLEPVL